MPLKNAKKQCMGPAVVRERAQATAAFGCETRKLDAEAWATKSSKDKIVILGARLRYYLNRKAKADMAGAPKVTAWQNELDELRAGERAKKAEAKAGEKEKKAKAKAEEKEKEAKAKAEEEEKKAKAKAGEKEKKAKAKAEEKEKKAKAKTEEKEKKAKAEAEEKEKKAKAVAHFCGYCHRLQYHDRKGGSAHF
eukprot:g14.t1